MKKKKRERGRKKKVQLLVSSCKSQKTRLRRHVTAAANMQAAAIMRPTVVGIFVTSSKKKKRGKANSFTTSYDNFDTCVKYSNSDRRRSGVRGQMAHPIESDRQVLPSRPRRNLFRGCCVDGASFQLSLPTPSAMGAHSWPPVFPWQTAISQSTSPKCSHRSPCSPPCQKRLSDSSSNVALIQVSAGALCGFDTIHSTFPRSMKRRIPCGPVILRF